MIDEQARHERGDGSLQHHEHEKHRQNGAEVPDVGALVKFVFGP